MAALHEKCIAHNFGGKNNSFAEHEIEEPTFRDKQAIMTSVAIAIDKSLKLEQHDASDDENKAAVDKWLAAVTGGKL